jgi:hypothetical protein
MRLAKSSRTLLPLALSAVLATCALAQDHPNIQPNAVRDQLNQAPGGSNPPAPAPQSSAPSTAPMAPKGAATARAKAAGKTSAGAKKAASGNDGKPPVEKSAEEKGPSRRDPFDTLLTKAHAGNGTPENLPPGKAGLIVETLHVDGIVHSPNGMIAIVSNAQQRVYFLREGDKLYDGSVQKIALDGISFNEMGKDAFGKPLERVVTKRLYPSPGEQQ